MERTRTRWHDAFLRYTGLAAALLVTLSLSCSSHSQQATAPTQQGGSGNGSDTQNPPPPIQTRISPNAKPLDDAKAKQATVKKNQLIFPKTGNDDIAALVPGMVLTSAWGDGYLRRVSSVDASGPKIVVNTEEATLLDVVEEGESETGEVDLDTLQPEEVDAPASAGLCMAPSPARFDKSLDGLVIAAEKDLGVTIKITRGRLHFSPKLNVGLKVQNHEVSFHAIASGELDADIHVEASCRGSVQPRTFTKRLWESRAFKLPMPSIGGIGIVVDARLFIDAGVEVSADGEVQLPPSYWTPYFAAVLVVAGGAVAVTVEPYVGFDSPASATQPWALFVGLRGRACNGHACASANECESGNCADADDAPGKVCGAPSTCSNGSKDGDEADVDCGGSCAPDQKCAEGQGCKGPNECMSGSCGMGGTCESAPENCFDNVMDGDERDVDCGGSCPKCPDSPESRPRERHVSRLRRSCATGAPPR